MNSQIMTALRLRPLLRQAAERLHAAGIDVGAAEAEIALCYLLDCERLDLYLSGDGRITPEIERRFEEIVARRETRYPLQYILGEAYFYGRRFVVNESVMVPTPETELLCENAIRYLKYRNVRSSRTLDIGCGSGVIAVTVSLEMSHTDITAVDICEDALNVARENAHRLGAQGIVFAQSDLFAALPESERFDLILSNPPYIADGDYDGLPPEVKADPRLALTSGGQGLDLIKRLIAEAPDYLAPGGKLMFEIGYDQAQQIQKLVDHNESFVSSVLMKDLNDVDRVFILSV